MWLTLPNGFSSVASWSEHKTLFLPSTFPFAHIHSPVADVRYSQPPWYEAPSWTNLLHTGGTIPPRASNIRKHSCKINGERHVIKRLFPPGFFSFTFFIHFYFPYRPSHIIYIFLEYMRYSIALWETLWNFSSVSFSQSIFIPCLYYGLTLTWNKKIKKRINNPLKFYSSL